MAGYNPRNSPYLRDFPVRCCQWFCIILETIPRHLKSHYDYYDMSALLSHNDASMIVLIMVLFGWGTSLLYNHAQTFISCIQLKGLTCFWHAHSMDTHYLSWTKHLLNHNDIVDICPGNHPIRSYTVWDIMLIITYYTLNRSVLDSMTSLWVAIGHRGGAEGLPCLSELQLYKCIWIKYLCYCWPIKYSQMDKRFICYYVTFLQIP